MVLVCRFQARHRTLSAVSRHGTPRGGHPILGYGGWPFSPQRPPFPSVFILLLFLERQVLSAIGAQTKSNVASNVERHVGELPFFVAKPLNFPSVTVLHI